MTALTKITGRFTEADIDDEIVVMRLDNGEFYSLSGTGAAIWRLIDGSRDRAALLEALEADYDGEPATLAADTDGYLRELQDAGLIAGV